MVAAALKRAADVAQRTTAFGLAGLMVYHFGQIIYQTSGGVTPNPNVDTTYFKKMKEQVDEDKEKAGLPGHRDWYDKDDQSYLKKVPRPGKESA